MSSMFFEFRRRLDCGDSRSGTSNDPRRWHILVKLKRSQNPQLGTRGYIVQPFPTSKTLEQREPKTIYSEGNTSRGNTAKAYLQSKRRLSGPESQTSKQRTSLVIRAGSRYHYRTSTSANWWWALGLWISDGPQDQELLESNVPFARRPILLCLDPVLASVSQTAWTKMAIWMTDLRRRVPAGARGRGDQEEGRSPQFTAPGGDSEPDSDSCTDQEMPAAGCPTATRRSSASPGTINCGALMDGYSASVSDIEPLDGDLVFLFRCSRGCRYYGDGGRASSALGGPRVGFQNASFF
ncbi:hypothetical protein DFH06DRAFT_1293429 [Mycena polygramma]|nr:hypothetical protein DFH06DRAFT_1293429 [Mycena polygramma]